MANSRIPHILPTPVIYLFMVIGLISAVAFRALTILGHLNPPLVRPVWYAGVIGYILFFAYRYYITEKRRKVIRQHQLIQKVQSPGCLSDEDRVLVQYLLQSISKSKENINYLFIFALSVVAIAVDLWLSR